MTETRIANMLHITTKSLPKGMHVAVAPDRETGEPTPYMEMTYGTLEMWLAMSDGAAIISHTDDGKELVMIRFDWLRENYKSDYIEPALERMEGVMRERGMIP